MLLYVRGEGGIGKTRVVKAIELGFALLNRREELIITAPTEAAASNIGSSTIHIAMSIDTPGQKTSALSNAWINRTTLIVDEIGMVSLKLLGTMDSQINKAKSIDTNSLALFGRLSLVVFMGDFFQFGPVGGNALWDNKTHTAMEERGKIVWGNFTTVITLTEQMQ